LKFKKYPNKVKKNISLWTFKTTLGIRGSSESNHDRSVKRYVAYFKVHAAVTRHWKDIQGVSSHLGQYPLVMGHPVYQWIFISYPIPKIHNNFSFFLKREFSEFFEGKVFF
jgi:hypothetical protein